MRIDRFTMFKVFLRSFFIQSAWSFEKMQGLGFAAAIAPAIKSIYKDKAQACEAIKRHMVFYNAHPYMGSPILGAVIKLEQETNEGKRDSGEVALFKKSLIGPYGAIGDTFFWGSVRPLASVLGVLSALIWGFWGPVVFLIVYNIFHLWMRWFGLQKGYNLGEDIVEYIKSLELPEWALRIRLVTAGFLGILTAVLSFKLFESVAALNKSAQIYQMILMSVFIMGSTVLLSALLRRGISVLFAIYLLLLPAFALLIAMNVFIKL